MGYFSNGSEGMDYEERYCDRCKHQAAGCAVWLAHMLHNYKECNNKESILNLLIPRSAGGIGNEQCKMFLLSPDASEAKDGQSFLTLPTPGP